MHATTPDLLHTAEPSPRRIDSLSGEKEADVVTVPWTEGMDALLSSRSCFSFRGL